MDTPTLLREEAQKPLKDDPHAISRFVDGTFTHVPPFGLPLTGAHLELGKLYHGERQGEAFTAIRRGGHVHVRLRWGVMVFEANAFQLWREGRAA